jgi:CTP synthase (UTP-ammonia lyase)
MAPERFIALIGERDPQKRAHAGIEASFARYRGPHVDVLPFRWLPTASIPAGYPAAVLEHAAGVWCTPGSPYEHTAGALAAVRFARERKRAFLGTCGGFQHALMEYGAAVLGLQAAHAELSSEAADPLIMKLQCSLAETRATVVAEPAGWYARLVGGARTTEEFNCNYGLSPGFEPGFAGSEIEFVARDEEGQVRVFRHTQHRFFVGTLFQPERQALRGEVHPLVAAFLDAASERDG